MVHAKLWNVFGAHRSLRSKNMQRLVEVCILQSVSQTHIAFGQVLDGLFVLPVCNIVRFDGGTRNDTSLTIEWREHLREVLMRVKGIRARRLFGMAIAMTKNLVCHIHGTVSPIAESLRYFEFKNRRLRNESVRRYWPFVNTNA